MILTRMTAVGTDGSRVNLWFDDGSRLRVATSLVGEFGLYSGVELDDETLERLQEAARKASAKNRAVRIVSTTAVSQRELQQRLVRKGERPEDAQEAVAWLEKLGAVDDEAMAHRIVERCIGKGYGKNRIRQELIQKGIPREFREEVLENLPELSESVDRFLMQKLRGEAPDQKTLKRITDALARRGFSWNEISAGIRRYREQLEDTDTDCTDFSDVDFFEEY